jgi:hypothetical protein
MSFGFVMLAPIAVGAVTVFFAERIKRRSAAHHAVASMAATALFVAGTLAALIEGLICAVIILPLFVLLGILGGLLMLLVCRLTNWPKQTLGCIVLLPLMLGGIDTNVPLPDNLVEIDRSVSIEAPAEVVWREILDAPDIRPEEIDDAWLFRIGVPLPLEGAMLDADQPTRRVRMRKNVYFDEVITEWRTNEAVRWTYRFHEDSFPRYALDEHVVIGGRYFDVRDTAYELTRTRIGTELRVRTRVRVSTRFNWYAAPVARVLMRNLLEANLNYYRQRSEMRAGG